MNYKEDGARRGYEPEVYSQIFEKEEAEKKARWGKKQQKYYWWEKTQQKSFRFSKSPQGEEFAKGAGCGGGRGGEGQWYLDSEAEETAGGENQVWKQNEHNLKLTDLSWALNRLYFMIYLVQLIPLHI